MAFEIIQKNGSCSIKVFNKFYFPRKIVQLSKVEFLGSFAFPEAHSGVVEIAEVGIFFVRETMRASTIWLKNPMSAFTVGARLQFDASIAFHYE